jgi:hypothetical protein
MKDAERAACGSSEGRASTDTTAIGAAAGRATPWDSARHGPRRSCRSTSEEWGASRIARRRQPRTYTLSYQLEPDYEMVEFVCDNNREYIDENGIVRMRLKDQ